MINFLIWFCYTIGFLPNHDKSYKTVFDIIILITTTIPWFLILSFIIFLLGYSIMIICNTIINGVKDTLYSEQDDIPLTNISIEQPLPIYTLNKC
jgi:hypothetical protein